MGRELRRVPLDFDWPLKKVWSGYLAPEHRACPDCEGGQNYGSWWMHSILGLVSVLAEESLVDPAEGKRNGGIYPHPYLTELPNAPGRWVDPGTYQPGDQPDSFGGGRIHRKLPVNDNRVAKLLDALYEKDERRTSGGVFGRYSISSDGYMLTRILLDAAGMDYDEFWKCQTCDATGVHPDDLAEYQDWNKRYEEDSDSFEPPTGDGYQLWETTSEGSPASPVFATIEELCEYAAENCTTFADFKASAEEWREMLDEDFVRTEVVAGDGTRMVFL